MKLNELKKLGKELTKKELINVAGGDVITEYQCADGLTGSVRHKNDSNEYIVEMSTTCQGHGGVADYENRPGKAYDE